MRLDDARLRRVVADALTLEEKIKGVYCVCVPAGSVDVERGLSRWIARVADGDPRRSLRRLRAEAWDEARVRGALAAVHLAPESPLPPWAAVLAEAAGHVRAVPTGSPMQAVLDPLLRVARGRVDASPHARLLRAGARASLESALARRLAATCEPALRMARAAFHATNGGGDDGAFVAHLRRGGFASLVERSPAIARLAATHVDDWAGATLEMLARLAADRRLLRATFAGGRSLGRVHAADAGLSDPHRRGRSVAVLEFDSGCRIVYKPRSLAVDAAWHALLAWLAARGVRPELRAPVVAERGTHGWAEFIPEQPCGGDAVLFGERAGALLALAHALGGTDFHGENVVACGAHPVLVDVEMLLSAPARPRGRRAGDAPPTPDSAHAASVLRTGLLPQWVPGPGGAARRAGAFSVVARLDALDAGFAGMYRALVWNRAALLEPGGPLAAFAAAEVRVLLRATWVYDLLLRRTRHPAFAASGVDRWIEIDTLARPWLAPGAPRGDWGALRAERADLAHGDVPIFVTRGDDRVVRDSAGHDIGAPRARSGHDHAAARVRSLGEEDLAVQLGLIRLSFRDPATAPCGAENPYAAGDFRDAALAIADGLLASADRGTDGDLTWLTPAAGRPGFVPAGNGFAHGRTGVALFLAACAAASGEPRFRDGALAALRPIRRGAPGGGVGIADGAGGWVYGLARIAGFLDDREVLRAADEAAGSLRGVGRGDAEAADLFGGMAGAVLGLLALHQATGGADALEVAAAYGVRLRLHLARCRPVRPGFAHGAAGIAHAFLRLHRATGDRGFLGDAEEAFALGRRRSVPAPLAAAWCHGAAGIGLARAAALGLTGTRRGVDASVRAACGRLHPLDTVCCGNMGAVELLLVASQSAGRPALQERACALAGEVVRRARGRRSYATVVEDRYAPGFFQGSAGIGYGLLRLADPARFPSVLLCE